MNIEQLAREAGFTLQRDERLFTDMLTRFAALVRAQALEDAAKVCDVRSKRWAASTEEEWEDKACADDIRALKE